MGYRPKWRLPLRPTGPREPVQSEAFKASWVDAYARQRKCTATCKRTGERCGGIAMRGITTCWKHKNNTALKRAADAEAERYGRPVILLRNSRNQVLMALGCGPWPEGLPHRPDLDVLGGLARGRLFEAWANRLMAPDVWEKEWTKKRRRQAWDAKRQVLVELF
jgi:hypothetical protein